MGNFLLRRRMMGGEAALAYGCYIQDTTGKLWKAGTWDGSATPNAVAVYDESCQFIIALWGDAQLPINSSNAPSSLTSCKTEEAAKADFDGAGNTDILLRDYGSVTTESAGYCAAYTFPNGETGYLGSAGEWSVAVKYKDEIDAIMTLLGEDALEVSYWTSTYYGKDGSDYYSWYFIWEGGGSVQAGDMNYEAVTGGFDYTRPFGVLDIKGVCGGSGGGSQTKIENKITIVSAPYVGWYAESEYPVTSQLSIETSNLGVLSIDIGETESDSRLGGSNAIITSISPTEDDTYIYTF